MPFAPDTLIAPSLDQPRMRFANADVLSLALMDARNHSLHAAKRIDNSLDGCDDVVAAQSAKRRLVERLTQHGSRLSKWCSVSWAADTASTLSDVSGAMLESLELMQDRLQACASSDGALAPYRASLELEDRLGQHLITMANAWANSWAEAAGSRPSDAPNVWGTDWPAPHALTPRQAIAMPSRRWTLGESAAAVAGQHGGFAWCNERHHAPWQVPAFDIDAQPVSWAQFVEFVDDGGYDREGCWTAQGWAWVQAQPQGRRAPLHVEHLGVASGAVMQRSFGRLTRRAGTHAAMHLSWFEADAYAHWAGRRLPTEHEWEMAAATARGQGFRWGDVMEWTCDAYQDTVPAIGDYSPRRDTQPLVGHMSIRGASFAARQRNKIAAARFHALPGRDDGFFGFRTCSH